MATNYVQRGENLTITGPAATNGQPIFAGDIIGIALHSASAGQPVDLATTGVWELPKVAADDVALGAAIYWDAAASLATIDDASGANAQVGVAVAAAIVNAANVKLRLKAF